MFVLKISFIILLSKAILGVERPKNLSVGKAPPYNVMSGNVHSGGSAASATGGDAPKEAVGKIEMIDQQPTGKNTTESGQPPRYPLNVESAEAQAHESRITGCRDHPDVVRVCAKAKEPCFCAEHEFYTYAYCRKSCKFCDARSKEYHKFWRLRAASSFNPSWMISRIELYRARGLNTTLSIDPSFAYSSSNYDPGFNAAKAFDDDPTTMWMPSGWSAHNDNDDWIGYEFPIPVHIGSVKIMGAIKYPKAAPTKMYVEAADDKYGPFETKWMIRNPNFATERVFSFIECDVLWRRYETGEEPICFRLIAKYKNWQEANDECRLEGGQLASVTSVEEQEFILNEVNLCGFTWIGLNDRAEEGKYVWTDKSNNSFSSWKETQVYDEVQRHYEDCVAMDAEGNWFTFSCQNRFLFLCKKTLVDPEMPIVEEPPVPESPPVEFIAPNYTVPVVVAEGQPLEEEQTESEKYNEMLASISMSRMKELGLKPPEAIANLESLPPQLGEKLANMTDQALKHYNKTKINNKLQGTEKLIKPPPKAKKPSIAGGKEGKRPTTLRVPSSPGQELVEELPGVKPLSLPGTEDKSGKSEKSKNANQNGQKARPPPAQEGGKDGETELSIGESGEEGPAEGQDKEEEPVDLPMKEQKLRKIKPKRPKQKKKKKKPESKAPEIPSQLKNPDLKVPSMPPAPPPPTPNYYGTPGYKKHKVGDLRPFSITFDGKQITNIQSKDKLQAPNGMLQAPKDTYDKLQAPKVEKDIKPKGIGENASEANDESEEESDTGEEKEHYSGESELGAEDGSGESGSGIEGFDPDLDEEFLDMAIDDIL